MGLDCLHIPLLIVLATPLLEYIDMICVSVSSQCFVLSQYCGVEGRVVGGIDPIKQIWINYNFKFLGVLVK